MINYAKLRNMKLLYNMEEFFYTKIELLNFIFTLPFSKLDARLESNALIFSGDLPVDIQLVSFLLLSSVNELSIGETTETFWWTSSPVKYIQPNKQSYPATEIYETFSDR